MTTVVSTATPDAIQSVLDAWIMGVEQEDVALAMGAVQRDESMDYIGAMAGEELVGWTALKTAMDQQAAAVKNIHIRTSGARIHVLADGHAAYATSMWTFEGEIGDQHAAMSLRCTWVLENCADVWRLVHFHKSVGLPA